jgi:hypothetical protein
MKSARLECYFRLGSTINGHLVAHRERALPLRLPRPDHRGAIGVLHLDPIPRRIGPIGALSRFDTMPPRPGGTPDGRWWHAGQAPNRCSMKTFGAG